MTKKSIDVRLPKAIEADPVSGVVIEALVQDLVPLRKGSLVVVPRVGLTQGLVAALRKACVSGLLVRGLEDAGRVLNNEKRGLALAGVQSGSPARVSRLILVASDGSDRFFRRVEALLEEHTPRVMALVVDTDGVGLGRAVFPTGRLCRLIMVTHKNAVTDVLLALAQRKTARGGVSGARG